VSDGNYVKTFVTSPSLLTNYFTWVTVAWMGIHVHIFQNLADTKQIKYANKPIEIN
jgi:hypothetical protein